MRNDTHILKVRSATYHVVKWVPGVHIKVNASDRACGTLRGRREMYAGPRWGNMKDRDPFQDLDVEGRKLTNGF